MSYIRNAINAKLSTSFVNNTLTYTTSKSSTFKSISSTFVLNYAKYKRLNKNWQYCLYFIHRLFVSFLKWYVLFDRVNTLVFLWFNYCFWKIYEKCELNIHSFIYFLVLCCYRYFLWLCKFISNRILISNKYFCN